MDVGKISNNLPNANAQTNKSVAFGALPSRVSASAKDSIAKEINASMPGYIKFMDKLRCLKGEAGSIIINALGTGLVAPIFIAFNPLSKTDEDTKKYTALRQPVSAVLAILIQAGLTKPLGNFYDYLANEGKLGKSLFFNQKILNSDSYIRKMIKQRSNSSANVDAEVAEYSKNQVNKVASELRETGAIKFAEDKQLSEDQLRKLLDTTMDDYLDNIDEKIKNCNSKRINDRVTRAQLLISEPKIQELCEELIKPNVDVHKVLQQRGQHTPKHMKKIISEFEARESTNDIVSRAKKTIERIKLFKAALNNCNIMIDNADEVRGLLNKIQTGDEDLGPITKQLREIAAKHKDNPEYGGLTKLSAELEDCCSPKARKAYAKKILDRLDLLVAAKGQDKRIIEVYQRAYYKDKVDVLTNQRNIVTGLQEANRQRTTSVKAFIAHVQEKISSNAMKSLGLGDFSLDSVKKLKSIIGKRLKGFKEVTSLLVGLFVSLPITCSALNWIYPRFMEVFFPNLANNKKSDAPEEKAKNVGKGAK
ncbi:hypothetical protein IJE86_05010 [bacterium]|nr:hypothetical protein [bacterium]